MQDKSSLPIPIQGCIPTKRRQQQVIAFPIIARLCVYRSEKKNKKNKFIQKLVALFLSLTSQILIKIVSK